MAREIEAKEERYRLGLDRPLTDEGWTVMELLEWWLKRYSSKSRSYATDDSTIRKHLPGTALAQLRIDDPDLPGHATRFLKDAHAGGLSKKTANNLRGYLHVAFSRAIEEGRYRGLNPISAVPKMKLPRRNRGSALAPDVARRLIDDGFKHPWRNLVATALYLGLRKGELFALRRSSVDLDGRRLLVCASHGFDTTKGDHDDWLPIPDALTPYLKDALERAGRSPYVFPDARGSRRAKDTKLVDRLHAALRRIGHVEIYEHKCRRRGCGHVERHDDDELRECWRCGFKLWPVGVPPPLRFHDLRHTTATLLLQSGCDIAAVQKILRHTDPRLTTETYGHISDEYLREQINRMRLG